MFADHKDKYVKTNVLKNCFASQSFVDDSFTTLPGEGFQVIRDTLDSIHVMPSEVFDVLITLKAGKASGPDGINNMVLSEAAGQLAAHLCALFNQSINISLVPSSWKIFNVCPVFKSGDLLIHSNY